jgi:hypothetical protein
MSHRTLRDALIAKKNWTKQQLSKRVRAIQRLTPMNTATAQAVVAHLEGLSIAKHLDGEETREIRDAISKLPVATTKPRAANSKVTPDQPVAKLQAKQIAIGAGRRRVIKLPDKFEVSDPILSESVLQQAHDMAAPYVLLHVLENSMREVVDRLMIKNYGSDWWDNVMKHGKLAEIADKAASRKRGEATARWHQSRGVHPIDYIDLSELGKIILAKQDDFLPVLGVDRDWFQNFMKELEPSRNVVCHMNRLKAHNVKGLEFKAAQWREMLEAQRDQIPAR